jgi:soluble lytic murein transglycosylase-like protein
MNIIFLGGAVVAGFLFMSNDAFAKTPNLNSPGRKKFGDAWNKYDGLFRAAAANYGVPFNWLKGIAIIESSLGTDPRVLAGGVSGDGLSWGLMQFTLPTARDYDPSTTPAKLNEAAFSIDLAGQFLADLKKQFAGDERKIIMSYNQGAGNTRAGKQYAAGYFTKFVQAVTLVEQG